MRYFFKSTRFKVILGVAGGLVIMMIIVRALGGWASPQSGIVGAIVTPVQRFSATVSAHVKSALGVFARADRLEAENERLRGELRDVASKIVDYEQAVKENEVYESFYGIKEENPDYKMAPARIVSYDPADAFGAFTIDRGSLGGVAPGDPVITPDGLVGRVHEAAPTFSTVITILSPDLNVSAIDSKTADAGSVSGLLSLAEKGLTRITYLSRQSAVVAGDYIVTSGVGGMFPDGLMIGTVEEIKQETESISKYATVKPAARLDDITSVMVITDFDK